MKTIIKIFITLIVIVSIKLNVYSQNIDLNIPNIFDYYGCGVWCWAFTSQNIINYYGEFSPSTLDVVDRVRGIVFTPDPGVTSCYTSPLGCCKTGSLVLNYWNISYKWISGTLSDSQLAEIFYYNQPIAIEVTGHVFIGEGISGPDLVNVLDPFYGRMVRSKSDIYPNKSWLGTHVMTHSPNWSYHNNITNTFNYSRSFSASSIISVSAKFQKIPSKPAPYFTFKTNGPIYLNSGFSVYPGCSLAFYTNETSCP
jgi:hypothetical protein